MTTKKMDACHCGTALLGIAFNCWLAAGPLIAADNNSTPKKGRAKLVAEVPVPEKSVAAIAELARHSVVTVSHFGRDGKPDGVGAGFIVASNGLIATCLHVIGEARPVTVQLADGRRFDATEIHAWDRQLDLAVIRIDARDLPALPLGDSDMLKPGASVVAIGNPLGLERSVVQGIVSGRRPFDGEDMIQLAIPIEPGNSGGPLLDRQGRVHGLLTLKSALSANLGFAMPVSALKPLLKRPNPVPMNRWLTIGALSPKEWTPLLGARWTQKAGRILVDGLGSGFGGRSLCLSQKPVPPQPYEVAVTVRLDEEAGAAGLVFASDGADRHYGFYPTGGQLRLTRFDGPSVFSWTILQTVPSPHYRTGDWNTIKVRVEADKLRCYVNDQLVIESGDRELINGQAGLAKFRDTRAQFKNFQLGVSATVPNAAPTPALAELARQLAAVSGLPDTRLVAELQKQADAGQALLSERARQLERDAAQLRQLAAAIHRQRVQAELLQALRGSETKIDLVHAALLLSKFDNPELDLEPYRRQLDDLARELAATLPAGADETTRIEALRKFLFVENGFHGSRTDYHNRANSYLNDVLDDREGLPITLSILFVECARRIGLENVVGVPVPAHFMVKHTAKDGAEQLIDAFDGGRRLTRTEAAEMVLAMTGGALLDAHLQPATKRDIIARMLRNLLGTAQRRESPGDALRYLDLLVALEPDSAMDRLNRARARLQSGDPAGAKADFKWLLDRQPPGLDLERIEELHRSL